MERKLLYAFRGWIAFVAFMDLGTAFRCYIERRSFLGDHSETQFIEGDYTISRILGIYCILKAVALVHCTLYIHYKPVVSMGGCSLAITMMLYITEALYFRSTTLNFYVIFPCILNCIPPFSPISEINRPDMIHKMFSYCWGLLRLSIDVYLSAITLVGLLYIPRKLRLWEHRNGSDNDDENSQLLKQMGGFKKRRAHKNKTP